MASSARDGSRPKITWQMSWLRTRAALSGGNVGAGALFVLQWLFPQLEVGRQISDSINHIDFVTTVPGYMLAFLLFAGAMQVDLGEMRRRWAGVAALATLGVAGSIIVVGIG